MRPGVAVDSATWAAASADRRRRPGGTRFAVSLSSARRSPSAARSPGRQCPPAAASPRRCLLHGFIEIVSQRAEAFQVARKLALEFVQNCPDRKASRRSPRRALNCVLRRGLSRVHGQQLGELDLCVQPAPAGFQAQALGGDVRRFLAAFRGRAQLVQPGRHAGQLRRQGFSGGLRLGLDVHRRAIELLQIGIVGRSRCACACRRSACGRWPGQPRFLPACPASRHGRRRTMRPTAAAPWPTPVMRAGRTRASGRRASGAGRCSET